MVIFHSYVSLPEGSPRLGYPILSMVLSWFSHENKKIWGSIPPFFKTQTPRCCGAFDEVLPGGETSGVKGMILGCYMVLMGFYGII